MKWIFAPVAVALATTVSLAAVAQGQNMMGGARAGASMGSMGMDSGQQGMSDSRTMVGMSEGEVRKVDSALGKLTLRHGPLENLEMPGMTMVFRVKDPNWLAQVKVGDKVHFVAERIDGNLTVTALELESQRR